jgi:CBS domain-containing protein
METDEPKFVQAAPESLDKSMDASEEKMVERLSSQRSGWGRPLREDELDEDADGFLTWISRYPVERNHPRPTTGTVAVKKSGDAVVCTTADKLSDVLQKLIVEGFLSMPVISSNDSRLVGYIDMLDIVWYCLWSFGAWREEVSTEKVLESKEHFATFLSLERFRGASVIDVLGRPGFGTRNQPHHTYKGFSLFHVFESMARMAAHRMAICNSERKVIGLVTQSMVISLLDQHMERLGTLGTNHTVGEMIPGLCEELKLVSETDLALSAFKQMVVNNVNGLAVVNSAGELSDSISVRDLRGMGTTADEWTTLWMNVKDFKLHCRSKFPSQTPSSPIFVTKNDTLEAIIKKMDDGNIHRVFVAEIKNGKPVPTHCISQRDVLRFILHLTGLKSTSLEDLERAQELS